MDSFIFLIYKVWFYLVDEENLMAMSNCALTFSDLQYRYIYCGFITISGHHITLDLYNENDSLKDK